MSLPFNMSIQDQSHKCVLVSTQGKHLADIIHYYSYRKVDSLSVFKLISLS